MSALQTAVIAPMPLTHLAALTTRHGIHEHADRRAPRTEHGYCTDDVARALTAVVREPERSAETDRLAGIYLAFLEKAVTRSGSVHNRMTADGVWSDEPSTGDWWGRAVAGLGATVRYAGDIGLRSRALRTFLRAAARSSADVRASAFAAVGAADVLRALPGTTAARMLLRDCLTRIPRPAAGASPGWPEPSLRYANAALCDALIAGGDALDDEATREDGLRMLDALLDIETAVAGHLSVTGSAGRVQGERGPLWDQQPIEPAALSDACARALAVTGDRRWARQVLRAWAWFEGDNDSGMTMLDAVGGAGYDGLQPDGRNENCGAESTIAAIRANQNARIARRWLS